MRIPGSWSGHQAADLPLGVLGHALGLHQSVGWTMNWAASQKNAAHCQRSARIPSRPHPEVGKPSASASPAPGQMDSLHLRVGPGRNPG